MSPIAYEELEPDVYYWAREKSPAGGPAADPEVVLVSSVFGPTTEFFTVVLAGSDEHHSLEKYDFIEKLAPPTATE